MKRRVEPEWLDRIPAQDPQAIRGRADLRRLNAWMGQAGIVAREFSRWKSGNGQMTLVELGAGCGTFALNVVRRLDAVGIRPLPVRLVERATATSLATLDEFRRLGWEVEVIQSGVFDWLESARRSGDRYAAFSNLFLHHFEGAELSRLLKGVSQVSRFFVACEPRRSVGALAASHLVGFIGCSAVTRHDAVVSVQAGFRDDELTCQWPAGGDWRIEEREAGWCSHLFRAEQGK
jgi:hypothetical protein